MWAVLPKVSSLPKSWGFFKPAVVQKVIAKEGFGTYIQAIGGLGSIHLFFGPPVSHSVLYLYLTSYGAKIAGGQVPFQQPASGPVLEGL
jgi:hypothetical protein